MSTFTVGKYAFTLEEVGHLVRAMNSPGGEVLKRILAATKESMIEALLSDLDERGTQRARGAYGAIEAFESEICVNLSAWYHKIIAAKEATTK